MKSCSTCRFYIAIRDAVGFCKRFPPVNDGEDWRQPLVEPNDWCGEYSVLGRPRIKDVSRSQLSTRAKTVLDYGMSWDKLEFVDELTEDVLADLRNCGKVTAEEILQWKESVLGHRTASAPESMSSDFPADRTTGDPTS